MNLRDLVIKRKNCQVSCLLRTEKGETVEKRRKYECEVLKAAS